MLIAAPQRVEQLVEKYRSQQDFLTVHARPGTVRRVAAALPALVQDSSIVESIAVNVDELERWGSGADATRYLTALSRMVRVEQRFMGAVGSTAQGHLKHQGLKLSG